MLTLPSVISPLSTQSPLKKREKNRPTRTLHPSLAALPSTSKRSHDERSLCRVDPSTRTSGWNDASSSHALLASCQRLDVENPRFDALAVDSFHYWDDEDGLVVVPASTLTAASACCGVVPNKLEEEKIVEVEREKKRVEHGKELLGEENCFSELFPCEEQEDANSLDFGVWIETEDDRKVEAISPLFTGLEECKMSTADQMATSSPVDVADMKQVEAHTDAEVQNILNSFLLDDVALSQEQGEVDAASLGKLSAALVKESSTEPVAPFSLLDWMNEQSFESSASVLAPLAAHDDAAQGEVAEKASTQDWMNALEIDYVSTFVEHLDEGAQRTKVQAASPPSGEVDPRVFVPTFSVRIEGGNQPGGGFPAVGPTSHLLVGPPAVLVAGPMLPPSRAERVGRWKSKRKTRSVKTKAIQSSVSDTRRARAAKRQRVKGRFVRDTPTFVSVTALQK
ncbi:hypothetical protein PsorP6_006702 [Peronosclerospora sorghi]|uniref:Uncharacterized protein n=1 Tax=Peronosclerospora sorghi TaxID=230839 RepID=A0ACC0W1B9_9STRA|nr:hypothetical protein PsorP6_006702 [Peronosclerospora sorghi]